MSKLEVLSRMFRFQAHRRHFQPVWRVCYQPIAHPEGDFCLLHLPGRVNVGTISLLSFYLPPSSPTVKMLVACPLFLLCLLLNMPFTAPTASIAPVLTCTLLGFLAFGYFAVGSQVETQIETVVGGSRRLLFVHPHHLAKKSENDGPFFKDTIDIVSIIFGLECAFEL